MGGISSHSADVAEHVGNVAPPLVVDDGATFAIVRMGGGGLARSGDGVAIIVTPVSPPRVVLGRSESLFVSCPYEKDGRHWQRGRSYIFSD